MYSVIQLAKMYGCTRATIYNKFKHEEIQQFLQKDEKGIKLVKEGLNVLNVIMSESNIKTDKQQEDTKTNNGFTEEKERYVKLLEAQIEELKRDKERLYNELAEQRKALLGSGETKPKGFLKRLFGVD